MGYPEYPIWKEKRRLRRYKCRICGKVFKDWYLPEAERAAGFQLSVVLSQQSIQRGGLN